MTEDSCSLASIRSDMAGSSTPQQLRGKGVGDFLAPVLSAFLDAPKQIHQWVGNGFESNLPSLRFYLLKGSEKDFGILRGARDKHHTSATFWGSRRMTKPPLMERLGSGSAFNLV